MKNGWYGTRSRFSGPLVMNEITRFSVSSPSANAMNSLPRGIIGRLGSGSAPRPSGAGSTRQPDGWALSRGELSAGASGARPLTVLLRAGAATAATGASVIDIEAARADLAGRGVGVAEIFHEGLVGRDACAPGSRIERLDGDGMSPGRTIGRAERTATPPSRNMSTLPPTASAAPAAQVGGVFKHFGATVALAGVDLDVPEGAVFGLLGPNGAGKTTLVRILATLLVPDGGRAEVLGHDVAREPAEVRELLGLTGQFAAVDEILTGRENLEMFGRLFKLSRQEASRRTDELLERFDLADAADRPARTYSGGMRRRLDLASSLLTQPRILFLDEPTTGLDPRSRNQIWAIVRELRREGTTLLLTTQYLEEADQLADRIAVIDHGRVIAEGTGNELKDRVGGQILEVELADAAERDRARAVLTEIGCGEPQPEERPDRLTLPAPRDGLELLEDAAAELRRAEIGVSDLGLRRPTLDDVFLQLTGAPPSEDGGAPPEAAVERVSETRPPLLRLRPPKPQVVRSAITDAAIVTGRNLRHFIRQPQLLIFSTIQPVMFVLLFVYVFGGAVSGSLPAGGGFLGL